MISLRYLLILAAALLASCSLAPNTIRTEVSHLSHLSQHFGDHRTNIGAEYAEIVAQWRFGSVYANLGEGYNISPADNHMCIGGICGPRELTTVAVGYEFRIK